MKPTFSLLRCALLVTMLLFVSAAAARAQDPLDTGHLNPSSIFSSNMVLQRRMAVPIWGWAPSASTVTVLFNGQKKSVAADEKGVWRVNLEPMEAGGPFALTMECSAGKAGRPRSLKFDNVMVGEVWFCSGQSNMEHQLSWSDPTATDPGGMGAVTNRAAEIAAANYPRIRMFNHYVQPSATPVKHTAGSWKVCTPTNAPDFRAIPYFFGRKLHLELDVPIGLVSGVYGGSPIAQWLSREALDSDPDLRKLPGSSLFNAYVHPVIPYAVRGFLWCQGEADSKANGALYRKEIRALIQDVRGKWGRPDLSFYIVQLAFKPGYGGDWPVVQEAQRMALELPHTGLAVAMDVGDARQIHYPNKQDPGLRLAMWALAKNFGKDVVYSGPLYDRIQVEGRQIRIHFREVGKGLKAKGGGALARFQIAGSDRVFKPASAVIDKDTVVVSSPEVPAPVAVRYAFTDDPTGANLFNIANTPKSGHATHPHPAELPAAPFRTDAW